VTAPLFRRFTPSTTGSDADGELTFLSTRPGTGDAEGHLRLIDFASNWGMLYKHGDQMTAPLYANLFRIFESMQATASRHGATFILVYFPRREQVQLRDWAKFHAFWNLDPDDFDLDLEATRLRSFCEESGIPFIDTTAALRVAAEEHRLYPPHDTHFNERGQAVAAGAIWSAIRQMRASWSPPSGGDS
jgi:hypothetical protein